MSNYRESTGRLLVVPKGVLGVDKIGSVKDMKTVNDANGSAVERDI